MGGIKGRRAITKLLRRRKTRKIPVLPRSGPVGTGEGATNPPCFAIMDNEHRWEIISAYGRALERCSSPVERESDLPYPKELIRQAIYEELLENPDYELRSHLEVAFAQLEAFVPHDEFDVVQQFKMVSTLVQEMTKSGDPDDIIASAGILKQARGERAVRIHESISEKMRRRLNQIRAIGMPVLGVEACAFTLDL